MKLRTPVSAGLSFLAAGLAAIISYAQAPAPVAADADKIARGKYLAEEVARCQDCHTPKTERGDFIKSQWMKGAAIDYMPAVPVLGWKPKSVDITSTSALFARWNVDGFVKFLETAKNPRGNRAGSPMPGYTMKHEDAEAVVAYLKSLP